MRKEDGHWRTPIMPIITWIYFQALLVLDMTLYLKKLFLLPALDEKYDSLAIRIDNEQSNYYTDTIAENWMKK